MVSFARQPDTLNPFDERATTTRRLPFEKLQGIGNDFVVIDAREWPDAPWGRLAPLICDRHRGVGSDGLLLLQSSQAAEYRMRMFNPDGTEDDCGNGLRCIVHFICRRHGQRPSLTVETISGVRRADVLEFNDSRSTVRIEMGQPLFSSAQIPMNLEADRVVDFPIEAAGVTLPFTCMNTGSTHAVTFLESPVDDTLFRKVSPALESHPLFPQRTSVIWAWSEARGQIGVRIWERGVGETLGCGTGAAAAAAAWKVRQMQDRNPDRRPVPSDDDPITVRSDGGALRIEWRPGNAVFMTGPAVSVFEGSWPLPPG